MMFLNFETEITFDKKQATKPNQNKTPEYYKGKQQKKNKKTKKPHLILEGLEKSHNVHITHCQKRRKKKKNPQYLKTCVFAHLCANYSPNALKSLTLLLYTNLTYFFLSSHGSFSSI